MGKSQLKKINKTKSSRPESVADEIESSLFYADSGIIDFLRKIKIPLARFSLFFVFFYFGVLKVAGTSSANPLVQELLEKTLPFIHPDQFIAIFGAVEMLIGLLFVLPGMERLAIGLLIPHMITTILPLILLPQIAWQSFLTPTLEGQYMLKNIVLIALAVAIGSDLVPYATKRRKVPRKG